MLDFYGTFCLRPSRVVLWYFLKAFAKNFVGPLCPGDLAWDSLHGTFSWFSNAFGTLVLQAPGDVSSLWPSLKKAFSVCFSCCLIIETKHHQKTPLLFEATKKVTKNRSKTSPKK